MVHEVALAKIGDVIHPQLIEYPYIYYLYPFITLTVLKNITIVKGMWPNFLT